MGFEGLLLLEKYYLNNHFNISDDTTLQPTGSFSGLMAIFLFGMVCLSVLLILQREITEACRNIKGYCKNIKAAFKCNTCGKNFNQKSNLKTHVRAVHENIKTKVCDTCQKRFGQERHLVNHILTVHQNLKLFQCEFCNKKCGAKHEFES